MHLKSVQLSLVVIAMSLTLQFCVQPTSHADETDQAKVKRLPQKQRSQRIFMTRQCWSKLNRTFFNSS